MEKRELFAVQKKFSEYSQLRGNPEWSWFVSDVLMNVEKQIEKLQKANQPSEEFLTVGKQIDDITMQYVERGADGNPIFADENRTAVKLMPNKIPEYKERIDAIRKDNEELFQKEDERRRKYDEFLSGAADVIPSKVERKNIHTDLDGSEVKFLRMFDFVINS